MKKVTIVNKFGPASNAITGQNAKELADFLHKSGIEVRFVCLQAEYVSAKKGEDISLPYLVRERKSVYTGRSPGIRFVASLVDGFRLWASSRGGKSDAVIVMTDPPLLFMWFQIFRIFSASRLIYWTMDLYPDAFVAGNYIGSSNPVYKLFHYFVYRKVPDLTIVLGLKQLAYLQKKFSNTLGHVVVPCGIIERESALQSTDTLNRKITFGYGGNIGEAHDAAFLISLAGQLDPSKHRMIASLYGSKADQVRQAISNYPVVEFREFLNLKDIAAMDVNIASLLPDWNNVCVPSKAVTAICCGTALLLNATDGADNWQMFKEAAWTVPSGNNYDVELKRILTTITPEEIAHKRAKAQKIAETIVREKKLAYKGIVKYISSL